MIHLKNFCELLLHDFFQLLQSLFAKIETDLDMFSSVISVSKYIDVLRKKP